MLYNQSMVMFVDYVSGEYTMTKDEALSIIMGNQDEILTPVHGIKSVWAMVRRTKNECNEISK